jgi:uncharacterized OB-fold protein
MTALMTESATEAELPYRQCAWCNSAMDQTRIFCPVCGSTEMTQQLSAGNGVIRRVVRTYRPQEPGEPLRQLCSVHLDEGFTVLATVRHDGPFRVPEGTRVQLDAIVSGHPSVEFTPVERQAPESSPARSSFPSRRWL